MQRECNYGPQWNSESIVFTTKQKKNNKTIRVKHTGGGIFPLILYELHISIYISSNYMQSWFEVLGVTHKFIDNFIRKTIRVFSKRRKPPDVKKSEHSISELIQ